MNISFEFQLPRSNKELLGDANCSNYFVKQVYDVNTLPALLRAAHQANKSNDVFYIFDHFDTFFSVIENVSQLQISVLARAVDILYRTAENLGRMLHNYFKQETLDRQNDFLNVIKMVMYLLVATVRAIDSVVKKDVAATDRKKKKNIDEEHFNTYDMKRYDVLVQVCNIMQLPIEKLWNMSIVDENFVNLLCDLAYRSLTHPSTKEKRVNDAIFQILGIAIKQYGHGMAFPVQIVEIMEREESAVVPIACGVRYLNDEFGITSVISNLLKELIDKVDVNPASPMTAKNLSLFITEIGEISPDLSLQCLEMAQELLNLEPYGIRNSLFGVMSIMIKNHLNGEDMNDDQRTLRDECMEDLWNHMNDISSYVRSKVLHIWNDLKNRNVVPLIWILQVINRAIERLEDKTATVRKNSIALLKSFLESNPFSSKLQMDVIEEKLYAEKEKARLMREKEREQYRNKDIITADYDERCAPELITILRNILNDKKQVDSLTSTDTQVDDYESEERVRKVRQFLINGEFDGAARYVIQLDALVRHQDEWKSIPIEAQVLYFLTLLKTYLFDNYESELEKQSDLVDFLTDSLAFSKSMAGAVPKLETMLFSTTNTDVLEAIEFFKTGYLFDIKGTELGMRLMLRLLYINTQQDKNEKGEAVIKTYHSVLFGTDAQGRVHHLKVVDNLYKFLQNISTGEYTAFELMIKHWVLSGEIDVNIINVLFERFTMKLSDTSSNLARCCMELLILVSNAKPAIAHSNRKLIIDIINSRRILDDPRIFAGCLKLLMNSIQPTDNNGNVINKPQAYYKRFGDKDVIDSISTNFKKFFFYPKLPDFELIATQSIDFLYKMCNTPDLICQEIIHGICKKLNEISQKRADQMMDVSENGVESSQVTEVYIPKYLLPRIIFVFGYIASKELVYLDNDVHLNMKYRKELHGSKKDGRTFNMNGPMNRTLQRLNSTNTSETEDQDSDSMYLGANAEDSLAEIISNILENQLIGSENGLFHHFLPILMEILKHPAKYHDEYIQRAAVLTLMRFMVVSGSLCSERIAFLMNILMKTKSVKMKCNIIIGLADLTSRFANTIEPWVPNFYTMLLETDETVRLTAMKMLSYMILQAIIRVSGQIADIAACIVDENVEIRNAAKEFFRQLVASKELEYYKCLPDIVSRLSSNQSPIAENKFQSIMKHLLELIQKDRQIENLVEKFCGRFRNTNTERQWRDIAFCLSLLNHTEKTLKKLLDHLPYYKDKVQCDEIYDYFKTIISNANKQLSKPELKNLAKELDGKLQKCLQGDHANISMDTSIQAAQVTPFKNRTQTNETEKSKKSVKTKNQKKKKDNDKGGAKKKTNRRPKKNTRSTARIWSSDESDDDFEE